MVHSPSWEDNWFAASQEIPRILWNPKVHYCTHKRPPPVQLGQPNPVHIPTSQLLEIHPNIIHPSTPRFPQWSLSLRFPHLDPILTWAILHQKLVSIEQATLQQYSVSGGVLNRHNGDDATQNYILVFCGHNSFSLIIFTVMLKCVVFVVLNYLRRK